jgi:hypothetical protein
MEKAKSSFLRKHKMPAICLLARIQNLFHQTIPSKPANDQYCVFLGRHQNASPR